MARYRTGYFASVKTMRATLVHVTNDGRPLCGYKPKEHFEFQWCASGIHIDFVTCKECQRRIPKLLRPIVNETRTRKRRHPRTVPSPYDGFLAQLDAIDKKLSRIERRNRAIIRLINKRKRELA